MIKKLTALFLPLLLIFSLTACGKMQTESPKEISDSLHWEKSIPLTYAERYTLDQYTGGAVLVTIAETDRFLILPEDMETPDDLSKDIIPLHRPKHIYLSATAVMDFFVHLDGLNTIAFSSQKPESWKITEARTAMEQGKVSYAGKYSAPDYEQLLLNCDLAIENTMIYHTPAVKEQLEAMGIPVMVDYSSYEKTPQGRMEWIKLYGVLLGNSKTAETVYQEQIELIDNIDQTSTDKTVGFFYQTSAGTIQVRRAEDSIPKMIQLAGGKYLFPDLDGNSAAVTLQTETFYAAAKDADYLIYNSAIAGEVDSLADLLELCPFLANCRAVQNHTVYCTKNNLYQSTMSLGTFTEDLHHMLTGQEPMTYLYRLE